MHKETNPLARLIMGTTIAPQERMLLISLKCDLLKLSQIKFIGKQVKCIENNTNIYKCKT